jgi:lipopolysaccharide export system permease protein
MANTYLVEIYKKYAIPFACVIFVLVGAPLGMIVKGGSFGTSALISLGFYILYWISLIGGEKLADRNILDPGIAIWSGNILIGVIGLVVAYKVNYEVSPIAALRQWLSARRAA